MRPVSRGLGRPGEEVGYIPLLEEPGLERRFGAAYRLYRRIVPRWIPRLRPWVPSPTKRTVEPSRNSGSWGSMLLAHLPIITFRSQQGILASRAKRIM